MTYPILDNAEQLCEEKPSSGPMCTLENSKLHLFADGLPDHTPRVRIFQCSWHLSMLKIQVNQGMRLVHENAARGYEMLNLLSCFMWYIGLPFDFQLVCCAVNCCIGSTRITYSQPLVRIGHSSTADQLCGMPFTSC